MPPKLSIWCILVTNYGALLFTNRGALLFTDHTKGYLLKNTTKAELLQAIQAVHHDKHYFNESITQILLNDSPRARRSITGTGLKPNLSPRESEVLNRIAQGLTTQQMATQLFVSAKAIEFHRSSLLMKFGVPNTALLIKTAMEMQMID
ncbi:helix-turn-helix transcriptional regulator [Dyadobacter koreensis]|uniref:helix-turn-helix transcriptional regulator n=1 Tax=Dyadobacter koreensis TaxID=408657 RepID=UPI000B15BF4F|nr:response regulator transcription factor [Dyadobacter koreensis]